MRKLHETVYIFADQETVNDFSDVLENRKPNIFVENNDLQSIDNKNEPKPKFTYGNGPKGV